MSLPPEASQQWRDNVRKQFSIVKNVLPTSCRQKSLVVSNIARINCETSADRMSAALCGLPLDNIVTNFENCGDV